MTPRPSAALVLALLASCKPTPKPATPTLEDDLATIAPVEASFDEKIPTGSDRIVVSTSEIRIAGDPYRIARMPLAKDEVEGTTLLPLRLALDGREHEASAAASASASTTVDKPLTERVEAMLAGRQALVVADKRTPFSTLAPIVATAATGLPPHVLLVVRGKKPSVLPLAAGDSPLGRRAEPDVAPRLRIDERGVSITVTGRGVARGCTEEGATGTVTVPKSGGEHDDKAIEACAKSLRQALGDLAKDEVWVTASSETELATLVRVIASFRSSFREVHLFWPRPPE